jgi:long-chain acyl-CoA synthetase
MNQTITAAFENSVSKHALRPALQHKTHSGWQTLSYAEFGAERQRFASALLELGTGFGDRVALLSENRPEWVIADQGILMAGCATVPVYPTLTGPQCAYVINDSGARILVLSNEAHLDKILGVRSQLPNITHIIVMDPIPSTVTDSTITQFKDVLGLGEQVQQQRAQELAERSHRIDATTLASIVYTSGTTGDPKGAMLTHGNFYSNFSEALIVMGLRETDSALSFLPLSHVLERTAYYALTSVGAKISFAEGIDAVARNLEEIKPTLFVSVPRLFEKIRARILDRIAHESPVKQAIFSWALETASKFESARAVKQPINFLLALQHSLADRFVFQTIREKTGGRLRLAVSGGAPLSAVVGEFFAQIGIAIIEGYGLTETSPIVALNHPEDIRYGTVGKALRGVEVRLADDGELLVRGPNVMAGYWNKPEATAQAITPEGWFLTGDIATIDQDGRICIVDRKKEIIVMSNGKNVAPQPVENALKGDILVEQAMLIGDQRNFISALIVPNFDALNDYAKSQAIPTSDRAVLLSHPQVQALFDAIVKKVNPNFAAFEQIKQFTLLPRAFAIEDNELTPTLKLKRRIICQNFQAEIDAMYTRSEDGTKVRSA